MIKFPLKPMVREDADITDKGFESLTSIPPEALHHKQLDFTITQSIKPDRIGKCIRGGVPFVKVGASMTIIVNEGNGRDCEVIPTSKVTKIHKLPNGKYFITTEGSTYMIDAFDETPDKRALENMRNIRGTGEGLLTKLKRLLRM
jgi:hypothetical protein